MQKARCNLCGVSENQWVDGKCRCCGNGHYCDMTPDMIIEQRVFDWFNKHGLLYLGSVYKHIAQRKVREMLAAGQKVPKYIIQYIES